MKLNNRNLIILASLFFLGGMFFAYVDRTENKERKNNSEGGLGGEVVLNKETTIFLGNINQNENTLDCSKVFPVKRMIENSPNVATQTINKLLEGPTPAEKENGFYTTLEKTKLRSIKVEEETAFVDFDSLPRGGACLVLQARAQIEETLKQFETIKKVEITVLGSGEDVLQP